MANEVRLRQNFMSGTITDNPLAIGATTINSVNFAALPTVNATNHLMLVLDPTGINGVPEIVKVTAHTAASTSVTVTRGQDGSTARAHQVNETWFWAPIVSDYNYTDVLTLSTNRPPSPYAGEMIYETDTKKLAFYNGTEWISGTAVGQLGYAEAIVDQAGITAEVDITSCATTVTVGTNRRIRITGCVGFDRTVADGISRLRIKEGATQFKLRDAFVRGAAEGNIELACSVVITPTAGPHTYKLTFQLASGTGTTAVRSTNGSSYILVEDIGAA